MTAETPHGRSMLSRDLDAAADVHTLVRLNVRPNRRENLRRFQPAEGEPHRFRVERGGGGMKAASELSEMDSHRTGSPLQESN